MRESAKSPASCTSSSTEHHVEEYESNVHRLQRAVVRESKILQYKSAGTIEQYIAAYGAIEQVRRVKPHLRFFRSGCKATSFDNVAVLSGNEQVMIVGKSSYGGCSTGC